MADYNKSTKRERVSSVEDAIECAARRIKFKIYKTGAGKYSFRPPIYLYEPPKNTQVEPPPNASHKSNSRAGDLTCDYCHMSFDNKDLLLGHRLRTPHGFNEDGKIVIVPSGFGIDDQARIMTPPDGWHIDESSNIVKTPALSNHRAQADSETINPPPFFEPGCPATGVFLPVGTPGTQVPGKPQIWYCPWDGCDKKNWKIFRVNRHINTTHVKARKSYFICNCGQAYTSRAEEEEHQETTGHAKAV